MGPIYSGHMLISERCCFILCSKNKTFVAYSLSFIPLKEQEELWKVYIDITFDVMAEFSSAFCINTIEEHFFVFRTRPV